MTPKEKAIELLKSVDDIVCGDINERNAKDMALWCVDEIMNVLKGMAEKEWEYWQEVKQEIKKS